MNNDRREVCVEQVNAFRTGDMQAFSMFRYPVLRVVSLPRMVRNGDSYYSTARIEKERMQREVKAAITRRKAQMEIDALLRKVKAAQRKQRKGRK